MTDNRARDAEVATKIMGYTLDYEFEAFYGAPSVPALTFGAWLLYGGRLPRIEQSVAPPMVQPTAFSSRAAGQGDTVSNDMAQPTVAAHVAPISGGAHILPQPTMPAAVTVVTYPQVYAKTDGTLYQPGATARPYVTPLPLLVAPGSYRVATVGGIPCVIVDALRVCDTAGLDPFKEADYAWRMQHGQMGEVHHAADEDGAQPACNFTKRIVIERGGVAVGEVTGVGCTQADADTAAERLLRERGE